MKSIKILSAFLFSVVLLYAASASAQDATTLYVDRTQLAGWNFSVRDGNTNHYQIKYIGLKILTPGVTFVAENTTGPASPDWVATQVHDDSVNYKAASGWITYPNADSMYSFALDFPYSFFDHPIQIRWNTAYSNTTTT